MLSSRNSSNSSVMLMLIVLTGLSHCLNPCWAQELGAPSVTAFLQAKGEAPQLMALKKLFEAKHRGLEALKKALQAKPTAEQEVALSKAIGAWPYFEVLGFEAGWEFANKTGLERVQVLVKRKEALLKKKWDKRSSLIIAKAVQQGLPYHYPFRGSDRDKLAKAQANLHSSTVFKLRDLVVEHNLSFLSWYYLLMLEHENPYFRGCALTSLGTLKAAQHVAAVAKLINDPRAMNRRLAITFIVECQATKHSPRVRACLKDKDREIRKHAAKALDALGDVAALPNLEQAAAKATDREKMIFRQVIDSLESIQGRQAAVPIIFEARGRLSRVKAFQSRTIQSVRGWRATWKKIDPKRKIPSFDANTQVAFVVFVGSALNPPGISVFSLNHDSEKIRLRLKWTLADPFLTVGGSGHWAIFVFAKRAKRLKVEMKVSSYINWHPKWQVLKTSKLRR